MEEMVCVNSDPRNLGLSQERGGIQVDCSVMCSLGSSGRSSRNRDLGSALGGPEMAGQGLGLWAFEY